MSAQEWIDVEDRLPDTSDMVLIYGRFASGLGAVFGRYRDGKWHDKDGETTAVTQWMPIPPIVDLSSQKPQSE